MATLELNSIIATLAVAVALSSCLNNFIIVVIINKIGKSTNNINLPLSPVSTVCHHYVHAMRLL